MKMEKTSALWIGLIAQLRPKDLLQSEHRFALRERIESLRTELGFDQVQFARYIRSELNELRGWLSGTRELTVEYLAEICGLFYISIADLVQE